MENASKALFIASALIITLATVTLIVIFFSNNQYMLEQGTKKVDVAIISYHNSQFIPYEKGDLTYSDVLSLIGVIVKNNLRQTDDNFIVNVMLREYTTGSASGYIPTENFKEVLNPKKNEDIVDTTDEKIKYLWPNSVYKGKVFKTTLAYNNMGIVEKVKIEKMN